MHHFNKTFALLVCYRFDTGKLNLYLFTDYFCFDQPLSDISYQIPPRHLSVVFCVKQRINK